MKKCLTFVLFSIIIFTYSNSYAARLHHEKEYQSAWCKESNPDLPGTDPKIEYYLPDRTRVDCLTTTHAIEFDFANKWAESGFQSLHYAGETGTKAGIAIIVEDEIKDQKYIDRIKKIIQRNCLQIDIWIVKPDIL